LWSDEVTFGVPKVTDLNGSVVQASARRSLYLVRSRPSGLAVKPPNLRLAEGFCAMGLRRAEGGCVVEARADGAGVGGGGLCLSPSHEPSACRRFC
jgi:hypothetical protein